MIRGWYIRSNGGQRTKWTQSQSTKLKKTTKSDGSRREVANSLHCVPTYVTVYLWLRNPSLDLCRFFSFLFPYTVGRTPWTGDQPVARPLPTHMTTETQNKPTDIHALSGIRTHDPSVRASEDRSGLDRAATVSLCANTQRNDLFPNSHALRRIGNV
jgi:hypothetical protein